MLPFGVTILATVPQGSEIPEGLMNYPVYWFVGMSPEILSNPKTRFASGFLVSGCRKFKDGQNHFLEYFILLKNNLNLLQFGV